MVSARIAAQDSGAIGGCLTHGVARDRTWNITSEAVGHSVNQGAALFEFLEHHGIASKR
ncbi:hypothetical protein MED193_00050 [Roseobacter sp. MED193]|jgi:hypothetical protein|nr:hypothetical protein MED193_00050 [Roseobacter sp. MED193]